MKEENDLPYVHSIYGFFHEIYGESFITYVRDRKNFSENSEEVSQLINGYIEDKAKFGLCDLNFIDQFDVLHPVVSKKDFDFLKEIFKKVIFHDEFEKNYGEERS